MPGLLEEFYSEDLDQYYYVDDGNVMYYYEDDDYYYVDDYYYADDVLYYDEEILYYDEEGPLYYSDEILYYEEEEPAMYFKKEINIAPKTVNTQRDAQGTSWDANSYEIDREIENIAYEEDVDYATAYRIFGSRYESYDPDLSDYM